MSRRKTEARRQGGDGVAPEGAVAHGRLSDEPFDAEGMAACVLADDGSVFIFQEERIGQRFFAVFLAVEEVVLINLVYFRRHLFSLSTFSSSRWTGNRVFRMK